MGNEPEIFYRKILFSDDHAATMVNHYEVNGSIDPHGHDFFEIALAACGEGGHVSVNGSSILRKGDVVIIRPGAWHGYAHCSDLGIYNCCFDQRLLQRELGWLREDAALNYLLWTGPYADNRRGVLIVRALENRMIECLDRLEALRKGQDSPRRAETIGRLLIFLESLAQAVPELDSLSQQARALHPAVLKTLHLLESQFSQNWSLKELAKHNHIDPSYLVRLFKAEIGLAPIAYLNRYRIERASGLLLHTMLPILEVSAQVGWSDQNLFSRRFRSAYGMSPTEYRKRYAKKDDRKVNEAHLKIEFSQNNIDCSGLPLNW